MTLENAIARYLLCKSRVLELTSAHDRMIETWAEIMRGSGLSDDRLTKLTLEACAKPGYCEVASILPQATPGEEDFG